MAAPLLVRTASVNCVDGERLGDGATARVYALAGDATRVHKVYLRQSDAYADEMLDECLGREARALVFAHPHIVRYYGLEGCTRACRGVGVHLVMERLGPTLSSVRANEAVRAHALPLLRQLLDALAYVHARGIVHGDVSPRNILFRDASCYEHVKLVDFGVSARLVGENPSGVYPHALVNTGITTFGTWCSMPLEVLARNICADETPKAAPLAHAAGWPLTAHIDVWAAGCAFYTMLTGTLPFGNGDEPVRDLARRVVREHACVVAVHPLLVRLLALNPCARPSSDEALALVDAALAGEHAGEAALQQTAAAAPPQQPQQPQPLPQPPSRSGGDCSHDATRLAKRPSLELCGDEPVAKRRLAAHVDVRG